MGGVAYVYYSGRTPPRQGRESCNFGVLSPLDYLKTCTPGKGTPAYEQRRVDLAAFRAVPASTWGHCPQVQCFTIVWDTSGKEKVAKWSSAPASILEGFT